MGGEVEDGLVEDHGQGLVLALSLLVEAKEPVGVAEGLQKGHNVVLRGLGGLKEVLAASLVEGLVEIRLQGRRLDQDRVRRAGLGLCGLSQSRGFRLGF